MKIVEVKHPLVKHKLEFDASCGYYYKKISVNQPLKWENILTYEATSDLETEKVIIDGWCGAVEIDRIKGKVTVVPILRADQV